MTHHTTPQDIPLKRCPTCGEQKPATTEYFSRANGRYDGLQWRCKECVRAYQKANKRKRAEYNRAHYEANKERIKEYQRVHYEANRERMLIYRRTHYQANKESIAEDQRVYRKINRERVKEYMRTYHKTHLEERKALRRRRRARQRSAEGRHTGADIKRQYSAQKGKCYYCGKKVRDKYHVEHVVPLSRGGSDGPDNIVIACPACNLAKHDKLPHEWPQGGRLL